MKIVNCTPHEIVLRSTVGCRGHEFVFPPSGTVARVATVQEHDSDVCLSDGDDDFKGISIYLTKLGEVEGLPDPERGVLYITSSIVAQAAAAAGRTDVCSPDTGPTALRVDGQIVAVTRLQRWATSKESTQHD